MSAVAVFLMVLSMLFYTFCAVWFLWAGEFEPRGPRWVRVLLWIVYGFLNWFVPNMWLNDTITMIVLCAYYMAVGWFFYHRSRNWLLYQVFFYMATYAAQIIGIFLVIQAQSVDCHGCNCKELRISYYEGSSYYNYYSGASFSCEETWCFRQEESEGKRNDACSNYQFRPYFFIYGSRRNLFCEIRL